VKKLLILFLIFALPAGFAAAADDEYNPIGLTANLEFGITDVNKPNEAEEMYPYLENSIEYENSFRDDTLDLYAGLAHDIVFTKEENANGKKVNPNGLWFDLILGYNLFLSTGSTLSVSLENENYFEFAPAVEDNIFGIIKPGVKFNQNIDDVGDIYFRLDVPFAYLYNIIDYDSNFLGLDVTLGWASAFYFGFEVTGHVLIIPNDVMEDGEKISGFTGVSATIYIEKEPVYFGVEAAIPLKHMDTGEYPYNFFDKFASTGVAITPSFRLTFFEGFSAYLSATIDKIGIKGSDVGISPAIGVTYSF